MYLFGTSVDHDIFDRPFCVNLLVYHDNSDQ